MKTFLYEKLPKSDKYKYRLTADYSVQLHFIPEKTIHGDYYSLYDTGVLVIYKGYSWDGASGPTIDTKNTVRASCVHDVLYQALKEKKLPRKYKQPSDKELQIIMLEDSNTDTIFWNVLNNTRAGYYYAAVRVFGFWALRT